MVIVLCVPRPHLFSSRESVFTTGGLGQCLQSVDCTVPSQPSVPRVGTGLLPSPRVSHSADILCADGRLPRSIHTVQEDDTQLLVFFRVHVVLLGVLQACHFGQLPVCHLQVAFHSQKGVSRQSRLLDDPLILYLRGQSRFCQDAIDAGLCSRTALIGRAWLASPRLCAGPYDVHEQAVP